MRSWHLPALLCLAAACGGPPKHDGPPAFDDYKVTKYTGPSATSLQLADTGRDTAWRAPLTPFLGAPVTFAGHLVAAAAACGENCSMFAIIDLKDGRVYRDTRLNPFCASFETRPTSALLIATPTPLPPGVASSDCPDTTGYYQWTGDTLKLLDAVAGGRPSQ